MKRTMLLLSISVLATLILGWVNLAEAQQAGKIYRIGYLRFSCGSLATNQRYIGFQKGLRELGYIEGQNFVIQYRCADKKSERRAEIAAELVRLKVDVIVTAGGPGTIRDAQRATRTIPIVFTGLRVDPVEAGFVESLARPGGNITGMTDLRSKLHPKRLELLKEAFPGISSVAILWSWDQEEQGMEEIEAAGQALGVQIQSLDVWDDLNSIFSEISQERADALIVAHSTTPTLDHRARVIEFTAKRRLPTMGSRSRFVDAGGLMSYGTNRPYLYRRAATYVAKILKGAKPADLPVERPTKFDLVINLKTAKQLGFTFPPEILIRADKVIK